MVCILKKCCFFIDLKLGCYLIGAYALLSNTVTILVQGIYQFTSQSEMSRFCFYLLCIVSIINIGFNIVFIYALKKDRADLVRMTLMYKVVIQVLEAICILVYIFFGAGLIFLPFCVFHLISLYCLLVIRSYYLSMLDQPGEPSPLPPQSASPPPSTSPPPPSTSSTSVRAPSPTT